MPQPIQLPKYVNETNKWLLTHEEYYGKMISEAKKGTSSSFDSLMQTDQMK